MGSQLQDHNPKNKISIPRRQNSLVGQGIIEKTQALGAGKI